jgi:hypothetical protein
MHIFFYVVSFLCNLYGYQDNEDEKIVMLSLRTSELFLYNILYWRSCWFALSVLCYLVERIKLTFTIQHFQSSHL